tara:strand:+ start:1 stop:1293 length:1293 start_codon:yes stop_codon:yes gene_type:complete
MSRVMNALLYRCYNNWMNVVDTRKKLRNRMIVSMKRWKVAKLQGGLNKWRIRIATSRNEAMEHSRKSRSAKRVLARMLHKRMSILYQRWMNYVDCQKGMRSFLSKWFNAEKNKIFNTWYGNVQEQIKNRVLLHKFLLRTKHAKVYKCYLHWLSFTSIRIAVRKRLIVALKRWSIASLTFGIHKWKLYILQVKNISGHHNRVVQLQKRMLSKMLHRELSMRFEKWCEYCSTKQRLKAMMSKVMHAVLYNCITKWHTNTKEKVRNRYIIHNFMKKMLHLRTCKSILTWRTWTCTRQALRNRMMVSIQRWKIAQFRLGFNKFYSNMCVSKRKQTEMSLRLKNVKRMLGRKLYQKLFLFFHQWCTALHEKRRLIRFISKMKNMHLYKSFHNWLIQINVLKKDKVIVTRCLKRMLLRTLNISYTSWKNYIFERRW